MAVKKWQQTKNEKEPTVKETPKTDKSTATAKNQKVR